MRTNRYLRVLALLTALAIVLAACGGASGSQGDTPADDAAAEDDETTADAPAEAATGDTAADTAASGEPIKIGGTLGLTGAFSDPAESYKAAYDLWLEQVNADGGIMGRPVEMIIYDDESTPATAQQLYQRLINQDDVDLLLAPFSTFIGGSILPIVEQNEMVLWNGGFVGINLFKQSDWIVGAYTYQEPDYPLGIFEIVDTLPEDRKPQRIGVATAQNPFTLLVRDGFEGQGGVLNFAAERGIEVVVNEEYAPDATDLSGIIQKARSADVDLFFALTLPNDGALMARTAQNQGFEPSIYCSCGSQVTVLPFWQDLGPAGDGIMGTAMAWPTDDFRGMDTLASHFLDDRGLEELPTYATVGYSILQVLRQAVEETGSLDQVELRDHVTGNTFETVNGAMVYDEDRIPEFNAVTVQFIDGRNEVVWPPDRATGEPVIPMNG